jgi:hypothetical protein
MSEILQIRASGPNMGPNGKRIRSSSSRNFFFERAELEQILSIYSRKVIAGEWFDYGIEGDDDEVAFAIYGRSGNIPSYRIIKGRRGSERTRFRIVGADGRILNTGPVLGGILGALGGRSLRLV